MSAPVLRSNVVACAFGPIGCGKSRLLADRFVSPHPRVLTIEVNPGETRERNPSAVNAYGLAEVWDAVRWVTRRGLPRWNVAANLDRADVGRLLSQLAPPPRSDHDRTIPRALGGLLIECGEADYIAPNGEPLGKLCGEVIRRSRHHLLSFALAAQRTYTVHRDATAQAHFSMFFRSDEPRDVDYVRAKLGARWAAVLPDLPRYWFLLAHRDTGAVAVYDEARRVRPSIP